ncbi:MAG TPA: O-antigen ligase family protein [Chthoniobacterales bacterium]
MSDICTPLRNAARWLFLAALVYAPWAYGCTTAATIRGLNIILGVALALWVVARLTGYWLSVRGYGAFAKRRGYQLSVKGDRKKAGQLPPTNEELITDNRVRSVAERTDNEEPITDNSVRSRTRPPDNQELITDNHARSRASPNNQQQITDNQQQRRWALLAPCALLLLLGWWMTLNARWIYDAEFFLFIPRAALFGVGPGSVDYSISVAWMLRATLLFGVVLFAAELSRDPVWLMRLWWIIALAGGSIALLGLIQKATGAGMIFWQRPGTGNLTTFFATYYAHGNAGAYLNLVLPAAIALALRGFVRKSAPLIRAVSLVLCLLLVVAVVANTSRGGQAVAGLLVVALTICLLDILFSRVRRMEKKTLLLAAGVIAFALLAIAGASHLDQSLGRWHETENKLESNSRWLASRAALRAVGDAGWLGFGPGTFRVVLPYYTNGLGPKVGGIWRFLHEDYLQTLMEWGWIGSAFWALLFFGSICVAVRTLRRSRDIPLSGRQRLFLTAVVLALAGIALHALVDFPLQIASLQLYVATYVGICWGSSRWN